MLTLQQLYLTVFDQYPEHSDVRYWSEQALKYSTQGKFFVSNGRPAPYSPLFRNLGIQDDFIPGIGISSDFELLYSATISGHLKCFDVITGSTKYEEWLNQRLVLSLCVIDKNNILVGLDNGQVMKWDGKNNASCVFQEADYSVNAFLSLNNPNWILLGPGQLFKNQLKAGKLYFLDKSTFHQLYEIDLNERIVFKFDGIWQPRWIINKEGVQVNQMVIRPNSNEVAFAFHHGEVSLFDLHSNHWRNIYTSSLNAVWSIAFNENGNHIYFTDDSGKLVDFNLISWSVSGTLQFQHSLTGMTASNIKGFLIIGDWVGTLYLVRQDTLQIEQSFSAEVSGCVRSLCCDPSGQLIAASGRGIRIFLEESERPQVPNDTDWEWTAFRGHGAGTLNVCVGINPGGNIAKAIAIDTGKINGLGYFRNVYCAKKSLVAIAELIAPGIAIVSLPTLTQILTMDIPGLLTVHGITLDDEGKRAACIVSTTKGTYMDFLKINTDCKQVNLIRRFSLSTRPGRHVPIVISSDNSKIAAVISQSADLSEIEEYTMSHKPVTVAVWDVETEDVQTINFETPIGSLAISHNGKWLFVGHGTQYEYNTDPNDLHLVEVRQVKRDTPKNLYIIRTFDTNM